MFVKITSTNDSDWHVREKWPISWFVESKQQIFSNFKLSHALNITKGFIKQQAGKLSDLYKLLTYIDYAQLHTNIN